MTFSIKGIYGTISTNDTQNNSNLYQEQLCWVALCWVLQFIFCYAECLYAECHYAESHGTPNFLRFSYPSNACLNSKKIFDLQLKKGFQISAAFKLYRAETRVAEIQQASQICPYICTQMSMLYRSMICWTKAHTQFQLKVWPYLQISEIWLWLCFDLLLKSDLGVQQTNLWQWITDIK